MSSVAAILRFSAIALPPAVVLRGDSINAGAVCSTEDALLLLYHLSLSDSLLGLLERELRI